MYWETQRMKSELSLRVYRRTGIRRALEAKGLAWTWGEVWNCIDAAQ